MFKSRIKQLQAELSNFDIESLLITSPYNIAYLTGIHAFSIEEREARIFVTKQNIYLFTDARYTEMVKEKAPFVMLLQTTTDKTFINLLEETINKESIKQIGFEEENLTYKETVDLEENFENLEFIPTSDIVEELREIKDNFEIEQIKKACQLTDKTFDFILKEIKSGMTETEVKIKLENFIRSQGGQLSFETIIAFGKNSAIPHHLSGETKLKEIDIVLLDFGAKVNGYCSDMTRTVFVGTPNEEIRRMYDATLDSQEVAIDYATTHTQKEFETHLIHDHASNLLKARNFPPIPHAIGHGVGLQVHEHPVVSPFAEDRLLNGMIITIEPGIYIPNVGGIRIEDTALVTLDGIELLTKSSKELIIL